jgi:NADH dehydrogenase
VTEIAQREGFGFVEGIVSGVDTARRQVTIGQAVLCYRCLVIAAGAPADRHRIPGANVHALFPCDVEDTRALCDQVEQLTSGTISVALAGERIGPGLEFAAWLARGLASRQPRPMVRVVADGEILISQFGSRASRRLIKSFASWGAEVVSGTKITSIEPDGVRLANGRHLDSTITAVVGPLRGPSLPLDKTAIDSSGFVTVDGHLRCVGHSDTFALGDAAVMTGEAWRKSWQLAVRQAPTVAANVVATLSGRPLKMFDVRIAQRLNRISLPDIGGKGFLVVNKQLISASRLARRIRISADRQHFTTYDPGGDRWQRLPS